MTCSKAREISPFALLMVLSTVSGTILADVSWRDGEFIILEERETDNEDEGVRASETNARRSGVDMVAMVWAGGMECRTD